VSRRNEIIQNKMRGIDDPEFSAVQNLSTQTWTVRKRKFPLDQSPKYREDPILVTQPAHPAPAPAPAPPPKDDLHLSWINMQSQVNDSLKKELGHLAKKYDKLSSKYEEKKTAKKPPKELEEDLEEDEPPEYSEPKRPLVQRKRDPPPPSYAPPPPAYTPPPPPPQRRLRPGQYARARNLSIVDF
jgi:hypothetical protein